MSDEPKNDPTPAEADATTTEATTAEAESPSASPSESPSESPAAGAESPAVTDATAPRKRPPTPEIEPMTSGLWMFLILVSAASAALDLWSKAWATNHLSRAAPDPRPLCTPPPGMSNYFPQRIPQNDLVLLRDFLDLQYAENCGGAWGLLHGASEKFRKPFFMVVTIGAIVFIVHLYRTLEKGQSKMRIALPLVLGGAIGNLVDRIRLGYVVDFIHAHWRTRAHWPTFNVADIAITVGIGLMLVEFIVGPKPTRLPPPPQKKPESADPKPAEPPAVA